MNSLRLLRLEKRDSGLGMVEMEKDQEKDQGDGKVKSLLRGL